MGTGLFGSKNLALLALQGRGRIRKMKKELIICIFIIVLIIVTNIITQKYTTECVKIMNEKLDVLKEASLKEDVGKIQEKISEVENNWNELQEKLAFYIEHDELEKVETQIYAMKGFYEIDKYDEIVPTVNKELYSA